MTSIEEEKIRFSDFVVAYLDVLGQREKLNRLRKFPTNEQETKDFENTARQTFFTVKFLRKGLKDCLELYRNVSCAYINSIPNISEEQKKQQQNLVDSKYHFSFFSDSYAVTSRYCNRHCEGQSPIFLCPN